MFFKRKKQVTVIGLDGVPYTTITRFAADGIMPNIAKLLKRGDLRKMSVSVPEVSSNSWASFMTGADSGTHGIYGFMDVTDGNRKLYFPNYAHLKGETIWAALEKQNKTTAVVNLPSTYPAKKINGVMVSGFVALDLKKSVYPPSLFDELQSVDYKIDVRAMLAKNDPDFLFRELDIVLEKRFIAFDIIRKMDKWDLFLPVVTGTDRLHHFFWEACENTKHKYHDSFLRYYRQLDEKLGILIASLPKKSEIMFMSDHGFTTIETEVYINRWLEEHGYLTYKNDSSKPGSPKSIDDVDPSSKAFALDPSRIYINKKSRFKDGVVNDNEVENLVSAITKEVSSLEYKGKKILKQVFTPSELYKGDESRYAPDIILLSNYGYDLKGKMGGDAVFGRSHFTGMHTQDDACLFSTAGLPDGQASIFDVKKYILNLLK